jgi:hypothetical protein
MERAIGTENMSDTVKTLTAPRDFNLAEASTPQVARSQNFLVSGDKFLNAEDDSPVCFSANQSCLFVKKRSQATPIWRLSYLEGNSFVECPNYPINRANISWSCFGVEGVAHFIILYTKISKSIVNLTWHVSALKLTFPPKFVRFVDDPSLGARNGRHLGTR